MKNILWLDDDKSIRETGELVLSRLFEVTVFSTGLVDKALDILNTEKIDLVITDVVLGNENGTDGIGFAREVRYLGLEIPILFITSLDKKELVQDVKTYLGEFETLNYLSSPWGQR